MTPMDSFIAVDWLIRVQDGASLLLWASLAALPLWYLTTYLFSPLRRFPGPFLAGRLSETNDVGSLVDSGWR